MKHVTAIILAIALTMPMAASAFNMRPMWGQHIGNVPPQANCYPNSYGMLICDRDLMREFLMFGTKHRPNPMRW